MASAASKQNVANAAFNAGWDCWAIAWNPDTDQYDYSFGTEEDQQAVTGSSKNLGGCISAAVARANKNPRPQGKP